MKRKLLLVLALIALPGFANALGLGKLQLNSALNQPFNARIELLSASAGDLDSLKVGLADTEAFRRAKIDRPFVLGKLRFVVKEIENGPDYIEITSRDGIREPFLNFLLEANWSTGRMYREYTVLLDPPLYDPSASRSMSSQSTSASSSNSYISDDAEVKSEQSFSPGTSFSGSEYGPTSDSDTLWSIATQVRPDNSVSVQQMMMALLRTNPEAFNNSNINGLKRGQVLNIPERDDIDTLSVQEAIAEVGRQNSSWQDGRSMSSDAVSDRPVSVNSNDASADDGDSPSTVAMIEDDESELRLVAASSDGAGLGQGGGDSSNDRSVDLSLANEQIEVVSQENAELKDRMREAETIIDDLKRLISLKDDELAALQQQMAGGGVVEPVEEMEAAIDTEEDPVFVEEPTDLIEDAEEYAVEDPVDEPEEDLLVEDQEEEPAVEDPQSSVSVVTETPAPASMLDKALGFIMGNLTMIAGALGGLILAIIALLFISRRKQNSESESVALASTEFPDFDDSEASVAKADEESAEMEATAAGSEDETVLPVEGSNEQEGVESAASPEPQEVVAAPEPDEPEEDLLGEVNVFLAYEHFDQAEEFVREAIAGSPDNLDFHAKLLEVFYAASDKKSYEEAAQVMHDKVNGQGPHWEMTQAMWQEMSPNRALFEEGADEPETAPEAESTGGIMDITAEESDAAGAGADLDFDLGMGGEIAAETSAEAESEDMLDLTAESDDVSVLDLTAAANVEDFSSDEDLLDVTAAVGLETEESIGEADSETADDEPILDITSAGEQTAAGDEDVLDFSHGGGEDLLDVTANANLEPEGLNEDLLDVTSAVGAEADGEELLEISTDEPAEDDNSVDFDIGGIDETADEAETEAVSEETSDDNALDFDIGGMDIEPPESESDDNTGSGDDNVLDFDMGSSDEEVAIELDADDAEDDGGIELDLSLGDEDVSLDIEEESIEETAEISIDDLEDSLDSGLEIDLSIDDDIDFGESLDVADLKMDDGEDDLDLEIDLTLDDEDEEGQAESLDAGLDMDFDLEIQEDNDGVPEIDMDGTVEMPSLDVEDMGIEIDDDDDDDDDDEHTVFVPRASAANEQSTEDEIATKLDLAKAYVELGDKDSAKGILDEVLADGNDEQKQTAQDLIKQLD